MSARKLSQSLAAVVALGHGRRRPAERPDQRRGRHVPVPDLFEVVRGVRTSCTKTSQINYQSIGSGGGIRQVTAQTVFFGASDGPMTPEQLLAAPGKILHFPTVLGAVVPVYNIEACRRAQVHRSGAGRYLPRQDHEVERSGDREAQSRCQSAGRRHHRRSPLRRLRHHLHLRGLPGQDVVGVEGEGGHRDVGELARRRGREGQRGRGGPREADAGRHRIRRAHLRPAEQDQLRDGAEQCR